MALSSIKIPCDGIRRPTEVVQEDVWMDVWMSRGPSFKFLKLGIEAPSFSAVSLDDMTSLLAEIRISII